MKKKEKGKGHFPWFNKQTSGMNDPIKKVQVRKRRDVGPAFLHRPHSSPPCSYPISIFIILLITLPHSSTTPTTTTATCHSSPRFSLLLPSSHSFPSSHNQTLSLSLKFAYDLHTLFTNFFPFLFFSHSTRIRFPIDYTLFPIFFCGVFLHLILED